MCLKFFPYQVIFLFLLYTTSGRWWNRSDHIFMFPELLGVVLSEQENKDTLANMDSSSS